MCHTAHTKVVVTPEHVMSLRVCVYLISPFHANGRDSRRQRMLAYEGRECQGIVAARICCACWSNSAHAGQTRPGSAGTWHAEQPHLGGECYEKVERARNADGQRALATLQGACSGATIAAASALIFCSSVRVICDPGWRRSPTSNSRAGFCIASLSAFSASCDTLSASIMRLIAAVVSVTPRLPAPIASTAPTSAMSPKVRAFSTRGRPSAWSCNHGSRRMLSADLKASAAEWCGRDGHPEYQDPRECGQHSTAHGPGAGRSRRRSPVT